MMIIYIFYKIKKESNLWFKKNTYVCKKTVLIVIETIILNNNNFSVVVSEKIMIMIILIKKKYIYIDTVLSSTFANS